MIVIAALLLGALYGAVQARRRGGNGFDMAQYAAGYGIAFALVGVFATIIIGRMTG